MQSISVPLRRLDTGQLVAIAEGQERVVYASDAYPHLVFKRQKRPDERTLKKADLKSFLLQRVEGFHDFIVRQEYKAYVKMCTRVPEMMAHMPVAKLYGFVGSDLGVLQVCEKVSLDGESVGPTLGVVSEAGPLDDADLAALNVLATNLLRANMPMNDINTSNIVKGASPTGGVRYVVIDGIGDIHAIPIRTFSARARKEHLIKSFSRFSRIGLRFDRDAFAFSFANGRRSDLKA